MIKKELHKCRKLKYFGRVWLCAGTSVDKGIQGCQWKHWLYDLMGCTELRLPELLRLAQYHSAYRRFINKVACLVNRVHYISFELIIILYVCVCLCVNNCIICGLDCLKSWPQIILIKVHEVANVHVLFVCCDYYLLCARYKSLLKSLESDCFAGMPVFCWMICSNVRL